MRGASARSALAVTAVLLPVLGGAGCEHGDDREGAPDASRAPFSGSAALETVEQAAAAPTPMVAPPGPPAPPEPSGEAGTKGESVQAETERQAARFLAWEAAADFVDATVIDAAAAGGDRAIAATDDGHVGVTVDGGATWRFTRPPTGEVTAVAGAPEMPWVIAGESGFLAISADGLAWRELPRYTNTDLIDVAAAAAGIVAVGKGGVFVRFDRDGEAGAAGLLPDDLDATEVYARGPGELVAVGVRGGAISPDGSKWEAVAERPEGLGGPHWPTSRGICRLARVGWSRGVRCAMEGIAYGLGEGAALVSSWRGMGLTRDGGASWRVSERPHKKLTAVFGDPKGRVFAAGDEGAIAATDDGLGWTAKRASDGPELRGGLVDGRVVVAVGERGTVVRSEDRGESWSVVQTPTTRNLWQVVARGGRYVIPAGKKALVSADRGASWSFAEGSELLEGLPNPWAKAELCEAGIPGEQRICTYEEGTSTPEGLPAVRLVRFRGDSGVAGGERGLLAFTRDGGAHWQVHEPFRVARFDAVAAEGARVVAVAEGEIYLSADRGASFRAAALPEGVEGLVTALFATDGSVYAAGKDGTLVKSQGTLETWSALDPGARIRTDFVYLGEVGGVVYAGGDHGELYRSDDAGGRWFPVATGCDDPVQRMTGEGGLVLALTMGRRRSGNRLLRSDDRGRHFFVQRVLSHQGEAYAFALRGGLLVYDERRSADFGATWTPRAEPGWSGAVPLGDGSGLAIVLLGSYLDKALFRVVGPSRDEWTVVDAFQVSDARVACGRDAGCWLFDGGRLYRPLIPAPAAEGPAEAPASPNAGNTEAKTD